MEYKFLAFKKIHLKLIDGKNQWCLSIKPPKYRVLISSTQIMVYGNISTFLNPCARRSNKAFLRCFVNFHC